MIAARPDLLIIGGLASRLGGVSTVGAGDAFAAFLAVGLGAGLAPLDATRAVMFAIADLLSTRAG